MNLLIHRLPTKDKYGHEIKTSFRNWINFQLAMNDDAMKDDEKILCGVNSVYDLRPDFDDKYILERVDGALSFLNGWQTQINETAGTRERVLDFNIDAAQIYASFYMQYGINLTAAKLHWYEFMALLTNLKQDTPMGYIMQIRGCKIEGTKEQREFLQKQKNLYRIDFIEYDPQEIVKKYMKEV